MRADTAVSPARAHRPRRRPQPLWVPQAGLRPRTGVERVLWAADRGASTGTVSLRRAGSGRPAERAATHSRDARGRPVVPREEVVVDLEERAESALSLGWQGGEEGELVCPRRGEAPLGSRERPRRRRVVALREAREI